MHRRVLLAAFLVLASAAFAADRPNFSGEWKINTAKSDFGPMPSPPTKMVRTVKHEEPNMSVVTVQEVNGQERTTNVAYTTDGKPATNKVRDQEVKSVTTWDGNALVIKYSLDLQGNALSFTERWTLAEDGKTYTVNSTINAPQGDATLTLVFEK